ncbi:type VI secretion protein IcmF/TssM N-terminal domain-containing protein, partial [Acinetobacter baumannii]
MLHNTLKQLNRCSKHIKISGIILCIDINDLLISDPIHYTKQKNDHLSFLMKLGTNLGHQVDLAIIFTKMDTL